MDASLEKDICVDIANTINDLKENPGKSYPSVPNWFTKDNKSLKDYLKCHRSSPEVSSDTKSNRILSYLIFRPQGKNFIYKVHHFHLFALGIILFVSINSWIDYKLHYFPFFAFFLMMRIITFVCYLVILQIIPLIILSILRKTRNWFIPIFVWLFLLANLFDLISGVINVVIDNGNRRQIEIEERIRRNSHNFLDSP